MTSPPRIMTSSLPSMHCGRLPRRRTLLLVLLFLVSSSLTFLILVSNSHSLQNDFANYESYQPRVHLRHKLGITNSVQKVVNDPLQYLTSKTVGPRCDSLLLIIVTSAPGNVDRRKSIRKTWAKRNRYNNRYDWQYVFAIGRSRDEATQSRVADEMNQYNDILYADFHDSYRNLTTKVMNSLAWARYQCSGTKFVLKTDDDCYVNSVILPKLLQDYHTDASQLYLGRIFYRSKDLEVLRTDDQRTNQWTLTVEEYPEDSYPPYASGSGYLLSMDLIEAILHRSRYIKPFPVEDAYFGVLIAALGIEPVHSGRFTLQAMSWNLCNFLYLLVVHHVTLESQEKFYNMSLEAQTKCQEPFITTWN